MTLLEKSSQALNETINDDIDLINTGNNKEENNEIRIKINGNDCTEQMFIL